MSTCQICEKRRPQRFCPGVGGDICSRCCGEEREVTIDCPLECKFLQEARRHEKPPEINDDEIPHKEIVVTEQFLIDHQQLAMFIGTTLAKTALGIPGVVDSDVREALESMIQTLLTLQSGVIYETRPNNPYAAMIQQDLLEQTEEYQKQVAEQTGVHSIRDKDILTVLLFLQRVELQYNNGRRRGRAFLDFLRANFPGERKQYGTSPIIAP